MNGLQKALLKAIDIKLKGFKKELKYNRTIEGLVTGLIGDSTYRVRLYGNEEDLKAIDGKEYEVGDIVKIIVYNDNYSDKAIWHKKP